MCDGPVNAGSTGWTDPDVRRVIYILLLMRNERCKTLESLPGGCTATGSRLEGRRGGASQKQRVSGSKNL